MADESDRGVPRGAGLETVPREQKRGGYSVLVLGRSIGATHLGGVRGLAGFVFPRMSQQVILSRVLLVAVRAGKRPRSPVTECFLDVSFEVLPRAESLGATGDGAPEGLDVIPKMRSASAF